MGTQCAGERARIGMNHEIRARRQCALSRYVDRPVKIEDQNVTSLPSRSRSRCRKGEAQCALLLDDVRKDI